MAEQWLIQVEDVHSGYGEKMILKGITTSIASNRITVVLGGSGCGKTTLLKNLLGFVRPTRGKIVYFGEEVDPTSPRMKELLKRFGIVFQNGALLNSMTVRENVELPLIMHTMISPAMRNHLVRATLARVSMLHAEYLYPSELSGGMKKRAAIARAIVLGPEILFCDEPAAGLDPLTAASLDNLLIDLRDSLGMTIVIITHELESIRTIADRVIMLEQGQVAFNGTLKDALACTIPVVSEFFSRKPVAKENNDNIFESAWL